ncbi:MAG: hypothetical protein OEY96_10930 [Gammaproteobacteria bacterium]|nr:hypothetical protein [Gammaproteobacteria bacterium]
MYKSLLDLVSMDIKEKIYTYEGVILNPRVSYKLKGSLNLKNLFNKKTYAHWQKHFPREGIFHRLKFSMEDTEGVEQTCSVKNPYVKFYTDDRISLICSKETDLILRVINKSKGKVWSEAYNKFNIPKSKFFRLLNYHFSFLVGYIKAIFRALPIINLFDMMLSAIKTKSLRFPAPPKHYVLIALASIFYLASYIYPFNLTDNLYSGKPTTYTDYPYQFTDVFDKGPSRLHHLIESGTIVKKSEELKDNLKPLTWLFDANWLFTQQELVALQAFYHSDEYNHATDYQYIKLAMILWLIALTSVGFVFHGAYLTVLRREEMRYQIALDEHVKGEIESTAFLYGTQ